MGWSYGTYLEELIKYVGPLANGLYRTASTHALNEWPKFCPQVKEMFIKKNMRPEDVTGWAQVWARFATAIEAVRVAAAAVGPEKVDGQAVYEALMGLSNFNTWQIGPPVRFSKTGRIGMDSVIIHKAEDQKVVFKGLEKAPDLLPGAGRSQMNEDVAI
jgi:hypothetical protein